MDQPMTAPRGLRRVRVGVPATSANLGPGFDAVGVALALRGEVELALGESQGAATDRGERMALDAAEAVYRQLGRPTPPLQASVRSEIPVARGLGASAMVRVGAAVAAATLAGADMRGDWLLQLTSALEGHADNAAPALLGGLQVIAWGGDEVTHVSVPLPEGLKAVVLVPGFEMSTDESRRLLPESLSRRDVVHNTSRAALLVAALATGRLDALRVATDDRLHQPARARLFPALYEIVRAATEAGAACAYLSGGGSSILAITDRDGEQIAQAMAKEAARCGVEGEILVTAFSSRGAEVIERS